MKAVILAGGLGTRISEESHMKPKPMIEIGGKPILWHIMKTYSAHGINEFVICLGYRGYMIKEYFANYFLHTSDVTFDMSDNSIDIHQNIAEPWKVTLVDTGEGSMTGGRLKRVTNYLGDEDFCFTYGDGLSDVNISELVRFHKEQGSLATGEKIVEFNEKPLGDGSWINGGYFVLSPKVIERIEGDATSWESEPLKGLAEDGELTVFKHQGFWQPMDTLRDKNQLEELWDADKAPWRVW